MILRRIVEKDYKNRVGKICVPVELVNKEVVVMDLKTFNKILIQKKLIEDVLNCPGREMFSLVTRTWNPVTGCLHYCTYCWARKLAETRLKNKERYKDGFKPRLNIEEFNKKFREGELIFVSDMGDLFGEFIPPEWIVRVLRCLRNYPKTYFLFLTKNPKRYSEFLNLMSNNVILGATIETNRDDLYIKYKISNAPLPSERYKAMRELQWNKKFISIEPILDFDLDIFVKWIKEIDPIMVYVGYDNYNNQLPEPPQKKTEKLIKKLSEFTIVVRKTIRPAWNEGIIKSFNCKRRKEDLYVKLIKWTKEFKTRGNKLKNVDDIHYSAHTWSILKLIALAYWVDVYTRVMKNHPRFHPYCYLDLFAGSGTNYIKETGDIIVGSAIIAIKGAPKYGQFHKCIYIENDTRKATSLERKLVKLGIKKNKYEVEKDDCNLVVPRILSSYLKDTRHLLVFIDPEGIEIKWSTMELLLKRKCDILFVFQTKAIVSRILRYRKYKALTEFFGDESWKYVLKAGDKGDILLKIYMEKLRKYRDYVESIRVKDRNFHYDIILACKKGPYISAWEELKNFIERATGEIIKNILKVLKGEIRTLEQYEPSRISYYLEE